jgi:2-oxoglutarate decarboxylase
VLFTPKRYLRGRESYSPVGELTSGHFREVLDDPTFVSGDSDRSLVRRVVVATGKVALDVINARTAAGRSDVAVVRVEQLHPWPAEQLVSIVSTYERASEVVWVQEEPANMGAANFVRDRLDAMFSGDYQVARVARVASGSPATGSHAMHELEQSDLLQRALG